MSIKKIVFYVMCALLAIMIIVSGITIGKAGILVNSILNPAPPATDSTTEGTEDPADVTDPPETNAPTAGTVDSSHQHSYVKHQTSPATCTEGGYTLYKCSCGDIETRDVVAALGHSYGVGKVITSCTEESYTKYECSRCAHVDKRDITPAAGHKFDIEEEIPANCTDDAKIIRKCSNPNCTETVTEFITGTSLGGHKYDIVEKTVAATCTENGYTLYSCSNSGCTAEPIAKDIIEATGHDFIKWFESGSGMKTVCEKSSCSISVHSSELEFIEQWRNDDGSQYVIEVGVGAKNIRRLYTYNITDNRSAADRAQNPLNFSEIDLMQGFVVTYTTAGGVQRIPFGFDIYERTLTIDSNGSASFDIP